MQQCEANEDGGKDQALLQTNMAVQDRSTKVLTQETSN